MKVIRRYGRGYLTIILLLAMFIIGAATAAAKHKTSTSKTLDPTRYEPECIHACQETQRSCMLICVDISNDADHKACVDQCVRKYVACGQACPLRK